MQAPDQDKVHCDSMAYFKIYYKERDAHNWVEELAPNTVDQQNITMGIEFNTEYRVMVVGVNNQNLTSNSAIHMITTMPSCKYCFVESLTGAEP